MRLGTAQLQMQAAQAVRAGNARSGFATAFIPYATTVILWALFVRFDWTVALVLGLVNSFICVRQIVLASLDSNSGPVALTFWPFVFVWICVGSIVQLSLGKLPWRDSGVEYLYPWAQALLTLAMLAHIVGGHVANRRPIVLPDPMPRLPHRPRVLLLVILAFALIPTVLAVSGGLQGRFTELNTFATGLEAAGASDDSVQLFLVSRLPQAVALVLGYATARAYVLRKSASVSRRPWLLLNLLIAVTFLVVLSNPFSNSRYVAFSSFLGLLLGFVRLDSSKLRAWFAAVFTSGLLILYPLASWFKGGRTSVATGIDAFTGIDFDGFQLTVNTLYFVQQRGFAFGEHILAAVGYFIPRSFWTTKAIPASFDIAAERGYHFQNLSLPLWSEFYLDLGLLGMFVAMFAYGWFSKRLDRRYSSQCGSLSAHLAVLFAVAQLGLLRGPLGGSVVFFGTVLLLGIVTFWKTENQRPAGRRPRIKGAKTRMPRDEVG